MAQQQGVNSTDMFYTNAFGFSDFICPDTTSIELQDSFTSLMMDVLPCSKSKALDEGKTNMTPYADDDEECKDEDAFPD